MNIPITPNEAFCVLRDKCSKKGHSIRSACELLGRKNQCPTFYRWRTNTRSYDISLFLKFMDEINAIPKKQVQRQENVF